MMELQVNNEIIDYYRKGLDNIISELLLGYQYHVLEKEIAYIK